MSQGFGVTPHTLTQPPWLQAELDSEGEIVRPLTARERKFFKRQGLCLSVNAEIEAEQEDCDLYWEYSFALFASAESQEVLGFGHWQVLKSDEEVQALLRQEAERGGPSSTSLPPTATSLSPATAAPTAT